MPEGHNRVWDLSIVLEQADGEWRSRSHLGFLLSIYTFDVVLQKFPLFADFSLGKVASQD
jgi:hypothetical protein